MSSARRLAVLGALYLAQGIVFGLGLYVLLPTLAARGVSLEVQAGIFALSSLPWVLKLAWGPLVDGVAVRRIASARTIAALATAAVAVALGGLWSALGSQPTVASIAPWWLLVNVALSLQDVATDAWAVDAVPRDERGKASGVMLLGHHVGAEALGGMLLLRFATSRGLDAAVGVVALLAIALAVAISAFAGRDGERPSESARVGTFEAIVELLHRRAALIAALLAATVLAADALTSATAYELVFGELAWTADAYASTVPFVALAANVLGYLVASRVVDRLGHRSAFAIATVALGATWVAFALARPLWSSMTVVLVFVSIQAVVTALLYVAVYALLMDATSPRLRATQLALYMALLNSPRAWAPLLAAGALATLGWVGLFVCCGLVQIGLVVVGRMLGPQASSSHGPRP